MKRIGVAVVQVSADGDIRGNLDRLERLLDRIPPVDLIALPEVFAFRGSDQQYRDSAEPINGMIGARVAELARRKRAWVSAGSIIENAGDAIYNTSVLLDRKGNISATYRKIHLFEAHLDDGRIIRETDAYEAGTQPVLTDIEGWRAGLAVCYDLRFPELFRGYSGQGAHLFLIPSNFTQRTGKDHWEVLVRARAIENQCFVVAANQCGANPATKVASYGNSMVAGPWGDIVCRASTDRQEVLLVELDPSDLEKTRARIPALRHRKL
jgi:predicted amidohydrolase